MDIETRTQKRLISNPDDATARAIAVDPATRYVYIMYNIRYTVTKPLSTRHLS